MAYRFEGDDIVIDGWERGIADGPYAIYSPGSLGPVTNTGMVDLSYGNLVNVPGEFSVEFPLVSQTISGGTINTPYHTAVQIPDGNAGIASYYYMLDSSGYTYNITIAQNWTRGAQIGSNVDITGNWGYEGLVWWKGYLIAFRQTKMYYSTNNGVTYTDWTSGQSLTALQGAVSHFAIVSVNDVIFFANGNTVGSIAQNPGQVFDPTNSATYTFQATNALIPSWDMVTVLAEVNGLLVMGGTANRLYVWDESSPNVNFPLFISDNYTSALVTVNTNVYVFSGIRGYIYISNGSQIDIFKKMPDNVVQLDGTFIQDPSWSLGPAIYHQNKIFFGASVNTQGGVWAIDLTSQALFRLNKMTTIAEVPTVLLSIGSGDIAVTPAGLEYIAATTGKILMSSATLSTSAQMASDRIPVGTFLTKRTFTQVEVKVAKALVTGESIDVYVSRDDPFTFTLVGSMVAGDGIGKVLPVNFMGDQWLQVKCVLNPTNTNPTYVRLREVRIR